MNTISRRQFLERGGAAVAATLLAGRNVKAYPLDGILGLQANDIRQHLANDYAGTLREIAGYGYKAIDLVASQTAGKTPKEIRQLLDGAGMICHNSHFSYAALFERYEQTIEEAHTLGMRTLVCQAPGQTRTADAWRKFADDLNVLGEKTKRDGILTGFHNHVVEFRDVEGLIPFDLLVQGTDPKLVSFMIDVGHLAQSGKDPLHYLTTYPDRYYALHAKEQMGGKIGFALGEGALDFKKIFAVAKADGIRDCDVETGAPAATVMEKLRLSIEYLKNLTV